MVRERGIVFVVVVAVLLLASMVQAQDRQEGGPGGPPQVVVVQPQTQPPDGPAPAYQVMGESRQGPVPPQLPVGPGPSPMIMMMREYTDHLRAWAREAQELSDRLRRQADELDQMVKRQMDRGRGPQDTGQGQRELAEIKEAMGRAEREGRGQEATALRRRAEELMGRLQSMQGGPGRDERQEIKGKIERLRREARMAKEQRRMDDSQRASQEADRLEQQLREQGRREDDRSGRPMPPEVREILKAAEQAEREGRMDDARRQREKAEVVARQWQEQGGQGSGPQGPRGGEPQEAKRKIERLRDEAKKAKEQNRGEEADRLWREADRLEQQLREQGPQGRNELGRPMPPEVQDILRSAEQAEREGRMEEARRQREKAEIVARQSQEQRWQSSERPGRQLKGEIMREMEDLKREISRLWQAVNEMRNRPREGKPT